MCHNELWNVCMYVHVYMYVCMYMYIHVYIFNSLLLEHKHSKQNDDIQYVSARKPSSAVHTQFTTANSKDEVECLVWNVSKSIVHRNAGLE